MQFLKSTKYLILVVLALFITACNSNKKINNSDESFMEDNINSIDINDNNNFSSKHNFLQIQELQHNNTVYFDLDKYDVHFEFNQLLDEHANFLRNNPSYKVTIEGHADERGTSEYNIALGERRSNAIKMYLQSKGVSSEQISIVSYGKEKPAILGHNELAYAKNRRAVLIY